MHLKICINIDNAAFDPDPRPEIERILTDYIRLTRQAQDPERKLYDSNGNRVGEAATSEGKFIAFTDD